MSKEMSYYNTEPLSLTLQEVIKYVSNNKKEYGCVEKPLFNIALDHVIPDELHLLLCITDVMLTNLLDDSMERDEKEDNLKARGAEKGVHLKAVVESINSCGVTFNIWKKRDSAKGVITMDRTSRMGNEKKQLLKHLPDKLASSDIGIHNDTRNVVVQLWKVIFILPFKSYLPH